MRYRGKHRRPKVPNGPNLIGEKWRRDPGERIGETLGPQLSAAIRLATTENLIRALAPPFDPDVSEIMGAPGHVRCRAMVRTPAGLYRIMGAWAPFRLELWCACRPGHDDHWHLVDGEHPSLDAALHHVVVYAEHITRRLTDSGAAA